MAGFWEEAKYWLDILSSHGVGVKAVSEVCPRAGGLSRRRPHEIIVVVVVAVVVVVMFLLLPLAVWTMLPLSCRYIPEDSVLS